MAHGSTTGVEDRSSWRYGMAAVTVQSGTAASHSNTHTSYKHATTPSLPHLDQQPQQVEGGEGGLLVRGRQQRPRIRIVHPQLQQRRAGSSGVWHWALGMHTLGTCMGGEQRQGRRRLMAPTLRCKSIPSSPGWRVAWRSDCPPVHSCAQRQPRRPASPTGTPPAPAPALLGGQGRAEGW